MSRPDTAARPVWIGASALTGGVLAAAVLDARRDVEWLPLGGIVLAVVVSIVVALATSLRRPAGKAAAPVAHPPQRPGWPYESQVPPGQPTSAAMPSSSAKGPAARSPQPWYEASRAAPMPGVGQESPPESVAIAVPGGAWWQAAADDGSLARGAAPTPDRAATAPVDLSEYGVATHVVQCPRCGDFGVDVHQQRPGFSFACRRCGHQWRWQPGEAWPVSVVRPQVASRRPAEQG